MSEGAETTGALSNVEIEHKFLVDDGFDYEAWVFACQALGPDREKQVRVLDAYYVPVHEKAWIYRHRYDEEIQQLTVKSRGGDTEVRTEINLDLTGNDQAAKVSAFMATLQIEERHEVVKQIHVFDFPDCEIVHYVAKCGSRVASCVEFEAIGATSVEGALAVLQHYESALGFDQVKRTKINLFDLLVG
jgi:CYTH domain-containing protein